MNIVEKNNLHTRKQISPATQQKANASWTQGFLQEGQVFESIHATCYRIRQEGQHLVSQWIREVHFTDPALILGKTLRTVGSQGKWRKDNKEKATTPSTSWWALPPRPPKTQRKRKMFAFATATGILLVIAVNLQDKKKTKDFLKDKE